MSRDPREFLNVTKTYQITLTKSSTKFLKWLRTADKYAYEKISELIDNLKTCPRPDGVKKLKKYDSVYRISYHDYRIVYDVSDLHVKIIVCLIGDRKEVYGQLSRISISNIKRKYGTY